MGCWAVEEVVAEDLFGLRFTPESFCISMLRFLAGLAETGWMGWDERVLEGGVGEGVEARGEKDEGPLESDCNEFDLSRLLDSSTLLDSNERLGKELESLVCELVLTNGRELRDELSLLLPEKSSGVA